MLREVAPQENAADGSPIGSASQSQPELPTPFPVTQAITGALCGRFRDIGVADSWVLARAAIYQEAIDNLSAILHDLTALGHPQTEAYDELATLAWAMQELFIGRISLEKRMDTGDISSFRGYYQLAGQPELRVVAYQRLQDGYSNRVHRFVNSNCQIEVTNRARSKGHQRGVLRVDGAAIRCGLRHKEYEDSTGWVVAIDSGLFSEGKLQPSQVTHPLSDSIRMAKQLNLDLNPHGPMTTFHYPDMDSVAHGSQKRVAIEKFHQFNTYLNQVFMQMVRG